MQWLRQPRNVAQHASPHCACRASQSVLQSPHSALSQTSQVEVAVCAQPVASAQLSSVQIMWSSQSRAAPLVQSPLTQLSPTVQALPSAHSVPSALTGCEQLPVCGSQVPVWHWSDGAHVIGLPPIQIPD